jgi:hydroxyacylglutathione hydrolase
MEIIKFTFNPFQENTILLVGRNKDCFIVDPGMYFEEEYETLFSYIENNSLKPIAVTNTHGHIDHVFGVKKCIEKYKIPFYLNHNDEFLLERAFMQAEMLGIPMKDEVPSPTHGLEDGDVLVLDGEEIKVITGPGHSPGHVAFYIKNNNSLVNGDILFQGSYGRVDLPGGDISILKDSITNKLFKLPLDTIVYCGHGPETTIANEINTNPILYS